MMLLVTLLLAASPLVEAKKDFAEGDFERAVKKLDAALKKSKDPAEAAQLQLLRAQCLIGLGKTDAARAAFTGALQKDPAIELDASRASPDAMSLFDQARAALPATIAVKVTGGAATLRIDGKDFGPAPLTTQLPPGPHVFEARASDGRSAKKELTANAGRKLEVELPLEAELKSPAPVAAEETKPPPQPVEAPPGPMPTVAARTERRAPMIALVPLAAGVAITAVGAVLLWQARSQYSRLEDMTGPAVTPDEEQTLLKNGPLMQTVGWVAVGVGCAAAVAGAAWFFLGGTETRVSLLVTDRSGFATVQGRF